MRRSFRPTGFTLLEILLALGAFAIMSATVIGVYLTSGSQERRGAVRQEQVGSARFLFEQMTRDIRLGTPHYEHYEDRGTALSNGAVVADAHRLAIIRSDNSYQYYGCRAHYQILLGTLVLSDSWQWCESVPVAPPGQTLKILSATIITSTTGSEGCVILPCTIPDTWAIALTENTVVKGFHVYISPAMDPFPLLAADQRQPVVTVAMTIESVGRDGERVESTFQTTASSRHYAR